jgi:TolB protein
MRVSARLVISLSLLGVSPAGLRSQPPLTANRGPVLKQIALPHAYYYREMYVPQVTNGPTAVTWSQGGDEIIYAMQGSLWRQRVQGDGVTARGLIISSPATQLTSEPCYHHQPDWSPNGRLVVFASYCRDAVELQLLDLSSGRITPITSSGAVNVDARWSPDGSRLAWVSTAFNGRWHIFVADLRGNTISEPVRITDDHDSAALRRYYYSNWDHYLSPSWSPDGREIILVSNRGRVHGTGGIWRMRAERGVPMREIHEEETTWKPHPDWSPDGKRIVYSSYLGRQWHQLWLTPSEGGDPFPLTYGEFDATMPRWSPDGRRIAFISNEDGSPALRIVDIPGGRVQRIVTSARRYRTAVGMLRIAITDSAGGAMPARVSITGPDGRTYGPDDAWWHADEGIDHRSRAFEIGYFHTTGRSALTVPPGRYTVIVSRGPEHAIVRREATVEPNATIDLRVALGRITNLPALGWWGGDLHVHMNYGGAYRNTPAQLARQASAEGLHVLENLIVNKERRVPDIAYFRTTRDPVSSSRFLLMHAQEYHTSVWGHTALLGLREHYVLPDYAGYTATAAASLFPDNATAAEIAHRQGGLMGYVHPFDELPNPFDTTRPLSHSLPVDAALGTMDYLEVMGYSDHRVTSDVWYRLLNAGLRVPAGAGTDAFPNFASLRGPPGLVRVYAHAGPTLDHRRFLDAIKRGRTFVTNAPLLRFTIEGREPGDELALPRGTSTVRARVWMRSNVPIDHLEIVGRGQVVATIPLRGPRTAADTTIEIPVRESGWFVLRAWNDDVAEPILDLYPFGSTSPVYVTVGGAPIRSPDDARFLLRWVERVDQTARASEAWNTTAERDTVLARIDRARRRYEALARIE